METVRSAGIIVFRNEPKRGRLYLLLHYDVGHWDFPKGQLEKGESAVVAAMRETEEETGIADLELIDGFKQTIKYMYKWPPKDKKAKKKFKFVAFFLGKTKKKKVVLSSEHQGFVWLPYEEALEKLTYYNAKNLLRKAENFLISTPKKSS